MTPSVSHRLTAMCCAKGAKPLSYRATDLAQPIPFTKRNNDFSLSIRILQNLLTKIQIAQAALHFSRSYSQKCRLQSFDSANGMMVAPS